MSDPRLMVSNWVNGVAVEWKCSCDGWCMELPAAPIKAQEKAAIVNTSYADHVKAAHR